MVKHPARLAVVLITVLAATSSATAVFMMKKDAERDAKAIGELQRKISAERQRISELEAEWSALDHPARLQALVDRHNDVLRLENITAEQIATVIEVASAARRESEKRGASQ
ncbi:hypothetical protein L1787_23880 [Acuticoccus sp. M5D2P5]|uniref:cell division protein FtsL n=1 Tax=Acuticoccus kalidii TaxID=2910977 RepID=UPI001F1AC248|nr:hypothetical protein [Acuticoccus kalidii]MCF3936437.1 hypothetical protein [Acuticoccus kalidii]